MKQKWTKELWHVIVDNETSDAVVVMRDEDSKNYYELGRFNTSTFSKGLALRNALRTVACINAMRGIKDPEEMRKALKEFWSEFILPIPDKVHWDLLLIRLSKRLNHPTTSTTSLTFLPRISSGIFSLFDLPLAVCNPTD